MTALLVLAAVAALDGGRAAAEVPGLPARRRIIALGVTAAVAVALVVGAARLADLGDVSGPSVQAGGGLVVVAAGLLRVVRGAGRSWDGDGLVVPAVFPVLLAPEVVAVAVVGGVIAPAATLLGFVVAVPVAWVAWRWSDGRDPRLTAAVTVRLGGVVLALAGAAAAVRGVTEV